MFFSLSFLFLDYINDGMYGSFNCITFDHATVTPKVLLRNQVYYYESPVPEEAHPCSIWGPTCDSIDCISKQTYLPKLEVGDWLYFKNMGAYTICAASQL